MREEDSVVSHVVSRSASQLECFIIINQFQSPPTGLVEEGEGGGGGVRKASVVSHGFGRLTRAPESTYLSGKSGLLSTPD